MLSLYEYNLLPPYKKAELLWQHGTYLLTREVTPFLVKLYSLGDFFVETYHIKSLYQQENREFQDLNAFRQQDLATMPRPHPLEPYLDQIDLSRLVAQS